MVKRNVTPGLDHEAIAGGIGELKVGNGSSRVVVTGKTLAYLKATRIAVRAVHVKRLPKKLGSPVAEANGTWANVAVSSTAEARAVLEHAVKVAENAVQVTERSRS
jgi:hypothetical protein